MISSQPKKNKNSSSRLIPNFAISSLALLIIILTYILTGKINTVIDQSSNQNLEQDTTITLQVEVLNGCGSEGIADKFTDILRSQKIDVVHTGNYRSFDVDNSMVIDRRGNNSAANKIANTLGISENQVIQQLNKEYFLDVSVIIGKDFYRLKN